MSGFLIPLASMGAILLLAAALGTAACAALHPPGPLWRAERIGWGAFLGAGLVAASVAGALTVGATPGWISFWLFSALCVLAGRCLRVRGIGAGIPSPAPRSRNVRGLLLALLFTGLGLYALRALTEPMWANDYLAIWGLKGKAIFGARGLPDWLWSPPLGFSHPEYPLGLPLLYAGLAFLLGSWDDHAMALVFPVFQAATLMVLFGWVRRRGAPWPTALAATALLAFFEPLYSAFLTGMADVPLACGMLLFGTAFSDAVTRTDSAALRRLAVASFLVAATKNEGLFLALAGAGAGAVRAFRKRSSSEAWGVPAAALLPASGVWLLHRIVRGSVPLRDLDFGALAPERIGDLAGRLLESLGAALASLDGWTIALLFSTGLLFVAGRPTEHARPLLLLAALCLAAYLSLPALAVRGPEWLVRTSLPRTSAALVPLVAAGLAARLAGDRGTKGTP